MRSKLKRYALEFIGGILFSLIAYIPMSMICLFWANLDNFGMMFTFLFLACPLGSIAAILITERVFFKIRRWNFFAIAIAPAIGLLGAYSGVMLLAKVYAASVWLLFLAPIITGLVLATYNIFIMFNIEGQIKWESQSDLRHPDK